MIEIASEHIDAQMKVDTVSLLDHEITYQQAAVLHDQLTDIRLAAAGLEQIKTKATSVEIGDFLWGSQIVALERYSDMSTHVRLFNRVYAHMPADTPLTIQRRIE